MKLGASWGALREGSCVSSHHQTFNRLLMFGSEQYFVKKKDLLLNTLTHTYTLKHMHLPTCTHSHSYTLTHVHPTNMHTYSHTYTLTHLPTCTLMYTQICILKTYTRALTCTTDMYTQNAHTNTHAHTHVHAP